MAPIRPEERDRLCPPLGPQKDSGRYNTLSFSARPLLLLKPFLKVPPGRIRLIPYRVDQTEHGALFVLNIAQDENVPSSRRPSQPTTERNPK